MGAVRFTMSLCLEGNHVFPDRPQQPILAGRLLFTGSTLAGHCSAISRPMLSYCSLTPPHRHPMEAPGETAYSSAERAFLSDKRMSPRGDARGLVLVRSVRLELTRYCYRQPLKLVRLPIPPRPQGGRTRTILANEKRAVKTVRRDHRRTTSWERAHRASEAKEREPSAPARELPEPVACPPPRRSRRSAAKP